MFAADVEWRKEFGTDTILEDFHFHERDAFISVYPQGYHKTDKLVSILGLCHQLFSQQTPIPTAFKQGLRCLGKYTVVMTSCLVAVTISHNLCRACCTQHEHVLSGLYAAVSSPARSCLERSASCRASSPRPSPRPRHHRPAPTPSFQQRFVSCDFCRADPSTSSTWVPSMSSASMS